MNALDECAGVIRHQYMMYVESDDDPCIVVTDYVDTYKSVFNVCFSDESACGKLRELFMELMREYINNVVLPKLNESMVSADFLREWSSHQHRYTQLNRYMARLLLYIDRRVTHKRLGLLEMAYTLYRELVHTAYADTLSMHASQTLNMLRFGDKLEPEILRSLASHVSIDRIMNDAGAFYREMAAIHMSTMTCSEYTEFAERCLEDERLTLEMYLGGDVVPRVMTSVHGALVADNIREVLEMDDGLSYMMEHDMYRQLSRVYRLTFNCEFALGVVVDLVRSHVTAIGMSIVHDDSSRHDVVLALLGMHDRYFSILRFCFSDNELIARSIHSAFSSFVGDTSWADMAINGFIDEMMRVNSSLRVSTPYDVCDAACLYRYVADTDLFYYEYHRLLSVRLLARLCRSYADEYRMIESFDDTPGYWSARMHVMLRDVNASMMNMHRFGVDTILTGTQASVTVCTTGTWSSDTPVQCKIPSQLAPFVRAYESRYLSEHDGRMLTWDMGKGQAEVEVVFSAGVRRTLVCTTLQMILLLALDDMTCQSVSLKELMRVTRTDRSTICNHLMSLVHPRVAVVLKEPVGSTLSDDDLLRINTGFKSRSARLKVPLIPFDGRTPADDTPDVVIQRHQSQVDVAIVRTCKTRKTVHHRQLVASVLAQVQDRFIPDVPFIKRRIDTMIDNEFIRRSDRDRGTYEYLP